MNWRKAVKTVLLIGLISAVMINVWLAGGDEAAKAALWSLAVVAVAGILIAILFRRR